MRDYMNLVCLCSQSTSDLSALQGQVFSHQGRSYVVHAPGLEIENHAVSTAPRAPPATVSGFYTILNFP